MPWAIDGRISTDRIEGGLEISQATYEMALAGILSGKMVKIENGGILLIDPYALPPAVEPPPVVAPVLALDDLKVALKADIDNQAEAVRLLSITGGAGQALTYQHKADEAMRYIDAYAAYESALSDYQTAGAAYQEAVAAWQTAGSVYEPPAPPVPPAAPSPFDYPMLSAEVGITGGSMLGVANVIKVAFANWKLIGAYIERTRLGAKQGIDAAQTAEAAQSVSKNVHWSMPVTPAAV